MGFDLVLVIRNIEYNKLVNKYRPNTKLPVKQSIITIRSDINEDFFNNLKI